VLPNSNMLQRLADGFPAGAFAEFTIARRWRELGTQTGGAATEGSSRLVRFVCPRDLPEMAN